jgi:hypothetical protein
MALSASYVVRIGGWVMRQSTDQCGYTNLLSRLRLRLHYVAFVRHNVSQMRQFLTQSE